jgi:multiple sugar transport system permease protein
MQVVSAPAEAVAAQPAPPPSEIVVRPRLGRRFAGVLLPVPAAILVACFLFGPIIAAFVLSLTNEALTGIHAVTHTFVGFANYTSLFRDPLFAHSAFISLIYVLLAAIVGQTGLGLLVAYMVHRGTNRWITRFVGSTMIAAWVMPEIVAALLWFAFAAQGGTLDKLLAPIGLGNVQWLTGAPLVLVSIATIWGGAAFSMLIFSAGFRGLPDEVVEAAVVDGARPWQRMLQVELPMLRRTFALNLILTTLSTFTDFTMIYALTGGGPGDATQTLPQYAYQQTFSFSQLGYGDAAAVVLLFIAAIVVLLYVWLLRVEV